jgi:hypothetical protein
MMTTQPESTFTCELRRLLLHMKLAGGNRLQNWMEDGCVGGRFSEVTKTGWTLLSIRICNVYKIAPRAQLLQFPVTRRGAHNRFSLYSVLSRFRVFQRILSDPTNPELRFSLSYSTTLTNRNLIQEEIKRRLNTGNACYHSVQNLLSSRLSTNINIRIHKL